MATRAEETRWQKLARKAGNRASKVNRLTREWAPRLYKGRRYRCNCCGTGLRFFFRRGLAGNADNTCPFCLAVERQRFALRAFEALSRDGRLSLRGRALHVAPERALGPFLQAASDHYIPIDLGQGNPYYMPLTCRADLTGLPLGDGTIDYVVCSHVLEHIADDRSAMAELARVLRPGGWAFLPVPVRGEETDEDPTVTDPHERARRFLQWDHVRLYGRADYLRRLSAAGLEADIIPRASVMSEAEARVLGRSNRFADVLNLWLFRKPDRSATPR